MSQSPVMSSLSVGALRDNDPSPTSINYPLSPINREPITEYSPLSWRSTPRSVQSTPRSVQSTPRSVRTPRSVQTLGSVQTNDESRVTPMDLNAHLEAARGGKKTRTKKTRTKKTRTSYKKSKKTRTYNKRGGKGFTTSETNGKESQ